MESLYKTLEAWGCAIPIARERFLGDDEFYLDCLLKFVKDENFEQLHISLIANDYKQMYYYAHSIKGVAGNLGISPISHRMEAILKKLRAEDYSDLEDMYEDVMQTQEHYAKIVQDSMAVGNYRSSENIEAAARI